MKVVVDYDLCEANALCMDCCPEVFRVEEDDTLTVLIEEAIHVLDLTTMTTNKIPQLVIPIDCM